MHTSCEAPLRGSHHTSLGGSNLCGRTLHLLATPSARTCRSEAPVVKAHARRADLSVAAQAVTESTEDLSIKTLDRPVEPLAQPRYVSDWYYGADRRLYQYLPKTPSNDRLLLC